MDISSDSSDTIILSSNLDADEPSDSEVENILKKYSSTSTSSEFKESAAQSNFHTTGKFFEEFTDVTVHKTVGNDHDADNDELSEDDLIHIPLIKRLKKDGDGDNIKKSTNQLYNYKNDRRKYSLDDESNDSDEGMVSENKNGNTEYLDMNSEEILRELNNKYRPSTSKGNNQQADLFVLSDDSDTNVLSYNDFPQRLGTFSHNVIGELTERRKAEGECLNLNTDAKNSSEDEPGTELDNLSPKAAARLKKQWDLQKKRKDSAREKERKREEAEKKKAMRNMEKERKREEMERQKAIKKALKTVDQSTKPDECIKHMIVELASEISQKDYGDILKTELKSSDISFKSIPQAVPNLISWCRKVQTIENMILKNTEVNEKHFLLIMDKSEFLQHIRKDSLTVHLQMVSTLTNFKMLTVAILGLDKVKADQDLAIVEAQLLFKCYFRFLKDYTELSKLVLEVTKAIAQIPHKAKKEEKYVLQTEYFNDSNKDTVRVDKNGNGLGRLWQQMLTMFPLARLETAEAITAVYPTPDSLFKAYDGCQSKKEELLQDLPIRRALGPCISVRKIGPELSRKCSTFFCSTDNVLI